MEPSSCYFCYTNMLVCFCSGHNTTLSYTEVQLSILKKKKSYWNLMSVLYLTQWSIICRRTKVNFRKCKKSLIKLNLQCFVSFICLQVLKSHLISSIVHISKVKKWRFRGSRSFLQKKMLRHWNRLPRQVLDTPPLETLKVRLCSEQPDLIIGVPDHCRRVRLDGL